MADRQTSAQISSKRGQSTKRDGWLSGLEGQKGRRAKMDRGRRGGALIGAEGQEGRRAVRVEGRKGRRAERCRSERGGYPRGAEG